MHMARVHTSQDPRASHSDFLAAHHSFALKGRVSRSQKRDQNSAPPKKFLLRELEFSKNKAPVGEFMEESETDSANRIGVRHSASQSLSESRNANAKFTGTGVWISGTFVLLQENHETNPPPGALLEEALGSRIYCFWGSRI